MHVKHNGCRLHKEQRVGYKAAEPSHSVSSLPTEKMPIGMSSPPPCMHEHCIHGLTLRNQPIKSVRCATDAHIGIVSSLPTSLAQQLQRLIHPIALHHQIQSEQHAIDEATDSALRLHGTCISNRFCHVQDCRRICVPADTLHRQSTSRYW